MTQHFIHYVPRRIASTGKASPVPDAFMAKNEDDCVLQPQFHRCGVLGALASALPGDQLWIVSQLSGKGGLLPPSLDAWIEIESIRQIESGSEVYVTERSRWLPLADAVAVLRDLQTSDKKGATRSLYPDGNQIGQTLRAPRRLVDAEALVSWKSEVCGRPLQFVSYRQCDGMGLAQQAVEHLMSTGAAVFWDQWSLPRRMTERREHIENDQLDERVQEQIHTCGVVWGIESPRYGEADSYSLLEKNMASELRKYQPYGADLNKKKEKSQ
jgi:hypothetical protein